jgi:hypothetical protein
MPVRLSNPGSTRLVDPVSQRNRTGTHLSTNINILVNSIAVGAVKQMSVRENRDIVMIDEVGTDGHIDSAPRRSTDISGSCQRTRFDRQRIAEAFLRGFVHVAAQRIPFDIEIQDNFAGSDDDSTIITTIRNVWIESIEVTYNAEDFIIVENMGWKAESIDSVLGNGSPVVGQTNNRGIPLEINPFERQADVGQYRGALDAAGLINAFDGDGGRSL